MSNFLESFLLQPGNNFTKREKYYYEICQTQRC